MNLPTHCFACGVVLRGGATEHKLDCPLYPITVKAVEDITQDDIDRTMTKLGGQVVSGIDPKRVDARYRELVDEIGIDPDDSKYRGGRAQVESSVRQLAMAIVVHENRLMEENGVLDDPTVFGTGNPSIIAKAKAVADRYGVGIMDVSGLDLNGMMLLQKMLGPKNVGVLRERED